MDKDRKREYLRSLESLSDGFNNALAFCDEDTALETANHFLNKANVYWNELDEHDKNQLANKHEITKFFADQTHLKMISGNVITDWSYRDQGKPFMILLVFSDIDISNIRWEDVASQPSKYMPAQLAFEKILGIFSK